MCWASRLGSIAFGHHAPARTRLDAARLRERFCGTVGIVVELEAGVVGAKSRRSIERRQLVCESTLPRHLAVGRHRQVIAVKLGPQRVGFTRPYRRRVAAALCLE